jgi:hypothetical protein
MMKKGVVEVTTELLVAVAALEEAPLEEEEEEEVGVVVVGSKGALPWLLPSSPFVPPEASVFPSSARKWVSGSTVYGHIWSTPSTRCMYS